MDRITVIERRDFKDVGRLRMDINGPFGLSLGPELSRLLSTISTAISIYLQDRSDVRATNDFRNKVLREAIASKIQTETFKPLNISDLEVTNDDQLKVVLHVPTYTGRSVVAGAALKVTLYWEPTTN